MEFIFSSDELFACKRAYFFSNGFRKTLRSVKTSANGSTADWYLDNMGRLGVDNLQGDQPGQEDIEKFQMALQLELRKIMGR